MNTQQKGRFAELKVEQRAAELGYIISRPTTDARYDFIIDNGQGLHKCQVKYTDCTPSKTPGSVILDFRRWNGNVQQNIRPYTNTEIDVVLAYIPRIDKICWIPPELFHNKPAIYLRLVPTKSGLVKGVHMAQDFYW